MIHYALRCTSGHQFDGWFKNSGAFEAQVERKLVACPECADTGITRGLMAPAIPRKGAAPAAPPAEAPPAPAPAKAATGVPDQIRAVLQRIRAEVERNSDYVGADFAEEARRIHRGETAARSIYGEASAEQAEALGDEGIEVARIPWVPRADG